MFKIFFNIKKKKKKKKLVKKTTDPQICPFSINENDYNKEKKMFKLLNMLL